MRECERCGYVGWRVTALLGPRETTFDAIIWGKHSFFGDKKTRVRNPRRKASETRLNLSVPSRARQLRQFAVL